jgi:hypothetical protein
MDGAFHDMSGDGDPGGEERNAHDLQNGNQACGDSRRITVNATSAANATPVPSQRTGGGTSTHPCGGATTPHS